MSTETEMKAKAQELANLHAPNCDESITDQCSCASSERAAAIEIALIKAQTCDCVNRNADDFADSILESQP